MKKELKNNDRILLWINIIIVLLIFLLVFLVIENIKLNISYGSKVIMPLIYTDIIGIVCLMVLDFILIRSRH